MTEPTYYRLALFINKPHIIFISPYPTIPLQEQLYRLFFFDHCCFCNLGVFIGFA